MRLPERYHGAVQLELFSPDRTALADGWEAVALWRLDEARTLFAGVLARWPDNAESEEALGWLEVAGRCLGVVDGETPAGRVRRMWGARDTFPQCGLSGRFRWALLARILEEMDLAGVGGAGESPCRGEVLLAADRPGDAIRWLTPAIKEPGARRDLRGLLGQALWIHERPKEARTEWLAWLVSLEPERAAEAAAALPDPELVRIVAAHGVDRAPLEAWLEGLAPLLGEEHLPGRAAPPLEMHRRLLAAEAARRRGELEVAVRHREAVLRIDRTVLSRYMDRLSW